ncbi:MAG: EAL domain-containing protein [Thiomonas sp.]
MLLQPDCDRWVSDALATTGVSSGRLFLEILEDSEFEDPQRRDATVRRLAKLGVRLAMDHLGSGYSSLLRLRTLPFHTVKIDQGLVREAHNDPEQSSASSVRWCACSKASGSGLLWKNWKRRI